MRIALSILVCVGLLHLSGCANTAAHGAADSATKAPSKSPSKTQANAPIALNDPCANRMQDIAGLLLLYSVKGVGPPAKLEDLRGLPGFDDVKEFVCPISHQAYIYNPEGIPAPDDSGLLVLYDATPAHSGMRWAIWIAPPGGNKPLLTKVIAVKDSYIKKWTAVKNGTTDEHR